MSRQGDREKGLLGGGRLRNSMKSGERLKAPDAARKLYDPRISRCMLRTWPCVYPHWTCLKSWHTAEAACEAAVSGSARTASGKNPSTALKFDQLCSRLQLKTGLEPQAGLWAKLRLEPKLGVQPSSGQQRKLESDQRHELVRRVQCGGRTSGGSMRGSGTE